MDDTERTCFELAFKEAVVEAAALLDNGWSDRAETGRVAWSTESGIELFSGAGEEK